MPFYLHFFSILFNYPKQMIRSTLSNNIFSVKQKHRNFNFCFFFSYFTSENNLEINVLSSFGCPNNHNPHSTLLDLFRYLALFTETKNTAKSRTRTKCFTQHQKSSIQQKCSGKSIYWKWEAIYRHFSLLFFPALFFGGGGRNLGLGKIVIFCTIWQESGVICWRQ